MSIDIPEIGAGEIKAPRIGVSEIEPPTIFSTFAPVTTTLTPPSLIFEIPGCVEAHIDGSTNRNLINDDSERGVRTFCGGDMPSFFSMDYRPDRSVYITIPKTSGINNQKPEDHKPPDTKVAAAPEIKLQCPIPGQSIPIGGLNKAQTKRVVGHEIRNGRCEYIFEALPLPEVVGNHLPGAPIVITTFAVGAAGIFGATLGKPVGDWVVKKVAKPILKKVKAKILKSLGKEKILSRSERMKLQRSLRK